MPVEQHPTDVKQDDDRDQSDAERNKEGNGFPSSADNHVFSLCEPDVPCFGVNRREAAKLQA